MFYPSLDFILGLSTPVKPRKPPKSAQTRERRGKRMTGHSKRTVRSGITLLQDAHGKRNLAFLTLTIPNLAWYENKLLCQAWGDITRRYMEELGRELERHGLNPEVVYVNELQEDRWRRDGTPAPHVHAVFQGRKTGERTWAISKEKARELWERILGNLLGRTIQLPAATRIEPIKKDAKRYMTKYMSKAGKVVDEIVEAGLKDFLPGRWWGMSHSLSRKVKDQTYGVTKDTAQLIAAHLEEYKGAGLIRWFGEVWAIDTGDRWEVECTLNGEKPQLKGQFRSVLSVFGEFTSKSAMMSFLPKQT